MSLEGSAPAAEAGPGPADPRRRIETVDALRGLALMGIVQINIQSFTWGAGNVLGYLAQPPQPVESTLYFLQAAFIEGKFYPIFAFLFGLGLALQSRRLHRLDRGLAARARALLVRRQIFLLLVGLLHGLLLYFGDVLAAYALCALLFLRWTQRPRPVRVRALLPIAWACALAAVLSLFVPWLIEWLLMPGAATDASSGDRLDGLAEALATHAIYSQGDFVAELQQRLVDEAWQQIGSVLTFWPQVLALLALGTLAGRLGWLQHPERHVAVWRRARQLGLGVGLPCALLGAALDLSAASASPGSTDAWVSVLSGLGSLLAAAYVAGALALLQRTRRLRQWLAYTGRASLSNYLMQSVLLGAILCGWGWGLGAIATRAQLAALGLLIFVLQVLASRWWLADHRQGPMEALWRRWTYGR
jgi:uncharacterized protein